MFVHSEPLVSTVVLFLCSPTSSLVHELEHRLWLGLIEYLFVKQRDHVIIIYCVHWKKNMTLESTAKSNTSKRQRLLYV